MTNDFNAPINYALKDGHINYAERTALVNATTDMRRTFANTMDGLFVGLGEAGLSPETTKALNARLEGMMAQDRDVFSAARTPVSAPAPAATAALNVEPEITRDAVRGPTRKGPSHDLKL